MNQLNHPPGQVLGSDCAVAVAQDAMDLLPALFERGPGEPLHLPLEERGEVVGQDVVRDHAGQR